MIELKTEFKNFEFEDEKEAIDKLVELFPDRDVTILLCYISHQDLIDELVANGFNINEKLNVSVPYCSSILNHISKKYSKQLYDCTDFYGEMDTLVFSKIKDEKLLEDILSYGNYSSFYQKNVVIIDFESEKNYTSNTIDYWIVRGYYCPRKLIKINIKI